MTEWGGKPERAGWHSEIRALSTIISRSLARRDASYLAEG
jgi:hypothetical protein